MNHKLPDSILFAGEVFDGRDDAHPLPKFKDGTTLLVRVRELPARHHLELLELFHVGREADLIQRCTEIGMPAEAGAIKWEPCNAALVDSLHDESHLVLADAAQRLNFSRAITTAQRQIARGEKLSPILDSIAKQVLGPMRKEIGSWMSSLTTELSQALAAKKP